MMGRQPLIKEARKEMLFALKVLLRELIEGADGSDVEDVVRSTARWILEDLDAKLRDALRELDEQVSLLSVAPKDSLPSPWAKIGGPDLAPSLANTWAKIGGPDLVDSLADTWEKYEKYDLAGKMIQAWKEFDERIFAAEEGDPSQELEYLALGHHTKLVREYTDIWTVYQIGWAQHQGLGMPLKDLPAIVDRIVEEIYAVTRRKKCRLYMDQDLIPVFFRNEAYTRTSRTAPSPYIVIPRWALRHLWLGCAGAHEVGHNVFWNIQGLFDELLAALMLQLASKGFSYDRQRVWGRWTEEIFADVFGLLQIGPAIISSQQRMLVHVPRPLLQKLSIGLLDDVIRGARHAYDVEHPPPYLRVWLSIEALDLLEGDEAKDEIGELEQMWRSFFKEGDAKPQGKVKLMADGPRLRTRDVSANRMIKDQGRTVLQVMLFTPLHALAGKDGQPRSMVDVFCHKPRYEKIETATQELLEPKTSNFFDDVDIRTVLAAAEYAFEQAEEDKLDVLSDRLVEAIKQTGRWRDLAQGE